ncbi:MAG: hypothetical protein F4089_03070 [Gammaproteobacteria bacterium]|nr:hypothetical protein [Gammaproteobacteria bacterium]
MGLNGAIAVMVRPSSGSGAAVVGLAAGAATLESTYGLQATRAVVKRQPNTWLLTGIPRSGSSLACRLAGELPDMVALSEPMARTESVTITAATACDRIEQFVARTRGLIERERRAPSLHMAGRLDDNVVANDAEGGLRRRQTEQGEIHIAKTLSGRFTLLIKHNALFAALLGQLSASFACVALVRNPLAALASWQTVDLPVNRGRIPAGEQFDAELRNVLDRTGEGLARQLLVLNWFFARYGDSLPDERILRYEDLVASGGGVLFRLLGHVDATPQPLASRNAHPIYGEAGVEALLHALTKAGGAWMRFYSRADCEAAAERLLRPDRVAVRPVPDPCP